MIFSKCKNEIYYLLSLLLKSYDIEIIKDIYNMKRELEDDMTLKWYINLGQEFKKYKQGVIMNRILFNPYHECAESLQIHHKKIFHLKIIMETFNLRGFILIKDKNDYYLPSLKLHIDVLNDFIKLHGILEIYNKIFQYHLNLTDLEGNRCIRCIIMDDFDYKYNTIALKDGKFIEPVDRLPRLIS